MDLTRRRWLSRGAAGALAWTAASPAARAQETFPDRPIHLVIPFPPGGPTDLFGRLVAGKLGDVLAQQIVVDNRPGAAGIIACEAVAKSRPDGYTLLFGTAATHGINASLYRKLPYHPLRDFSPVAFVGVVPSVLLVPPTMPATLREFLDELRAHPGKYTYGSSGSGTTNHLAGEMLNAAARVQARHVPYKGSAPAMQDLLGGQIDFMFETFGVAMPHLQSGRLRAVAVAWKRRSTAAPDVPTFGEAGLEGFEASTWNVVMAPAGTPAPIVARLNGAVNEVMRDAGVKERLVKLGIAGVDDSTPQSTADTIASEIERWGKAVAASGARAD